MYRLLTSIYCTFYGTVSGEEPTTLWPLEYRTPFKVG